MLCFTFNQHRVEKFSQIHQGVKGRGACLKYLTDSIFKYKKMNEFKVFIVVKN